MSANMDLEAGAARREAGLPPWCEAGRPSWREDRDSLWQLGFIFVALLTAIGLFFPWRAEAAVLDYRLEPRQVAPDTWVFVGRTEDFSRENGGNIVNTGFIATPAGTLVVDTGPSFLYGKQMRVAIARVGARPVVKAINSHEHPDHFLGNQAYQDVPILALPETIRDEQASGAAFNDNMYRMNGDWMKDTEPYPATVEALPGRFLLGGHDLELIRLSGHTDADLVLLDHSTGVLFAGDLAFNGRTPTTPHAHLKTWLKSLDVLQKLPFKVIVPGHGAPATDDSPIRQTRDYLLWLGDTLRRGAEEGRDMAEMLQWPIPERFRAMALARQEYQRSVSHLFPRFEKAVLDGDPQE